MRFTFCLFLIAAIFTTSGCTKKADKFTLHRGLNASHWLSQTKIRGEERAAYMTEKDFKNIADMGFDHVRLPFDEEQFWNEAGEQQAAAFELMHNAIKWSMKYNMRVIVDLHTLRSHHFNIADNRQLWEDENAQNDFISFWKQLSAQLKDYPNDMLAYEPMNEAVADNPEDWNKLINWVINEIRELEPERPIIMGSNRWQQVGTFKDLRVPENDPNIILSFHFYNPMLFTHHTAPWVGFAEYSGPITYPGKSIPDDNYGDVSPELRAELERFNQNWTKETMEEAIMQAVVVAQKYNLPLYCGEFGAFPSTPLDLRATYYRDLVSIFEKHHIAWAHWNYKNDFPVVDKNLQPIPEIVNALFLR